MAKRIVIAGILGGLTMFVWLFVAHEFLPLGEMECRRLPTRPRSSAPCSRRYRKLGFTSIPALALGPSQLPDSATRLCLRI